MRAFAALFLLPSAVMAIAAQADDLQSLTFTNHTELAVSGFSVFEERPDGTIIDDNLGAWVDEILPGDSATLDLALIECRTVRVYVTFTVGATVPGGENFDTGVDLCANRTLTLLD